MSGWTRNDKIALYGAGIATLALVVTIQELPSRAIKADAGGLHVIPSGFRESGEDLTASTRSSVTIAATASSVLIPSRVARYDPANVLDGRRSTIWSEGAAGDGVGEWIELSVSAPVVVRRVSINNGYDRENRFFENGRIREASLSFSDGTNQRILLRDTPADQSFPVSTGPIRRVRLTILSVYPGRRWPDTTLGEFKLWITDP